MKNTRIASIVVSAGYSSRMHSFKPFLKFGKYTAVETVITTLKNSGIDDIILVVGYRGSEVIEKTKNFGVVCVVNENYSQGMYSSVLKGVEALEPNIDAFFMQPVDVPLVKGHTIDLLKNMYLESHKGIIYPAFCGKRGHPPLIDSKYKHVILNGDGEGGLKKILERHEDDSLLVPVFDEAVLMDMDRKKDYQKLLRYFYAGVPNRKECYEILNSYNVPAHIIKHCTEVARVALDILDSLKGTGCELDGAALEAAALLHDIARREKRHARMGEKILKEIGYEYVGYIISTHIDIAVNEKGRITENEILYLADKLVKEDSIMPLESRFRQYMNAYGDNLEALEKIKNRYDAAEKIIKKLENSTGKGFIYG